MFGFGEARPRFDYFKEHAIELAWDLVTKSQADGGWGFDEAKLYPSVYVDDPEAVALWRKVTGLPDDRIARLASLRTTGRWACRSRRAVLGDPDRPRSGYGADGDFGAEDRYLEFWNLVFMQDELSAVRSKEDFDIAARCRRRTSTPAWVSSGSRS